MGLQANSEVRARINEHIKIEAADVLSSMGLTVSDAIRILLTSIAKQKALPEGMFSPSKKTLQAMKNAEEGKTTKFQSIDEFMKDLDADD